MLKKFLHRAFWWYTRRKFPPKRVSGMSFLDGLSESPAEGQALERHFENALAELERAGHDYYDLVRTEIELVAALKLPFAPRKGAIPWVRVYVDPFLPTERANSRYLAIELVWAATYIRCFWRSVNNQEAFDRLAAQKQGTAASLLLAEQRPGWDDWVKRVRDEAG